jgi:N-acetylglucosamine kinase-like BadF-type ATPase
MTRTKQILNLLKQGPLTRRQIFDQAEGTVDQIKFAVYYLTKKKKIIQKGSYMELRVNTNDGLQELEQNPSQQSVGNC